MKFQLAVLVVLFGNLAAVGLVSDTNAQTYTPGWAVKKDFASFAKPFLADQCLDCHGQSDPEGDLSLEDLGPVTEVNADTWRSVWAQVSLKEMPPQDASQPTVVERLKFTDWIVAQLTHVMRDKGGFHDHLDPNKGNFVDHDLLFASLPDSIQLTPTSSPARLWRVTPQEHMTRLNELINLEPKFDPDKPGLRAHGDGVPTNHGGELKLYFGTDRIISWAGGTVAYATSVKSVPAVLSSARDHGLENYADFYSVNSAESTQILAMANDIIRYMMDGPLSIAEPYQITDDPDSIKHLMVGDVRGLSTSLVYGTQMKRPVTPVYQLMQQQGVPEKHLRDAINFIFETMTLRPPSARETDAYLSIAKKTIDKLGKKDGLALSLSTIFLDRDALFRPELAKAGKPDQHNRVMLQDWELGLAVNHALRYLKPDDVLRRAIDEGRMRTQADVKREVLRMLASDPIRKPRILRFFRDYFDYDLAGYVCKDKDSLAKTGVHNQGGAYYFSMFDATASTDRLVEMVLKDDKDVLKRLLTTDKAVVTWADRVFFGRERSATEKAASIAAAKDDESTPMTQESRSVDKCTALVKELNAKLEQSPEDGEIKRQLVLANKLLETSATRAEVRRVIINHGIEEVEMSGPEIFARVCRRSFGGVSMEPERFLVTVPPGERLGILTHPSWLVSHSDAMDNHAIRRGRWIRERLLGGGIPDVPITVDAMLPDEPDSTLRERMRVTRQEYCWTCHKKMDPLGLPFERYNHTGLIRLEEQKKPVNTTGEIIESGVPTLDGKVANANEMIQKIASSERAEQVFVRHAFRFWMGRNETLHDAPVLQQAHRAYKDNGGSMNALLVSLLTSDAFLYRTRQ